jgi:hypothetical protein
MGFSARATPKGRRSYQAPPALSVTAPFLDSTSNRIMIELDALGVRSYVAEPARGRRDWSKEPEAQAPVYANRRRIRGPRGRCLMRRRGEYVERAFAHVYDTGGMRRTHLRGHPNILKRLLIHAGGFNLGLVMRQCIGLGTPRGLQGRLAAVLALVVVLWTRVVELWHANTTPSADHSSAFTPHRVFELLPVGAAKEALYSPLTTGC